VTVIGNASVVTAAGVVDGGWVAVSGNRIDAVGPAAAAAAGGPPVDVDLGGRWLLPGFVDTHVHGGGGASCLAGDPDETARMVEFHRAHGTTTTLASLVTAPVDELVASVGSLADLVDDGLIAGIHLEGPFLSAQRCGAQNPAHLAAPDRSALDRMLAAGRGHVRMVTIAPELPGALDLVDDIVVAGVVAAVGHSDATYDQAAAAFDRGASVATHLRNGMRPMHHRDPGIAGAALDRDGVVCEVIADGIHLHEATLRLVARAAGPGRVSAVSDAMAAAGMPDGAYVLGELAVTVTNGAAYLTGGDTLAGSTLTTGAALRRLVGAGLPVADVAAMLATTPARSLGLGPAVGDIAPGAAADLVVCGPDASGGFAVDAVMARGRWIGGRPA
jgi:N-acetylglucosamine-6-phosphate deacetylase